MRKLTLFLLASIITPSILAQEVCKDNEEKKENLNDIASIAKCTVVANANGTNAEKDAKVVVISRSHQKRRAALNKEVQTASKIQAAEISKLRTSDSIERLRMKNIKKQLNAINNAIEELEIHDQIAFDTVEIIPSFPDCDTSSYDDVDCFNYEMQQHLINNIVYPKKAVKERIEGDVWVSFVITKNGDVKGITTSGPEGSEDLKKEAQRVISLLPKFIPGKQNDAHVNVNYTFPISFNLQN